MKEEPGRKRPPGGQDVRARLLESATGLFVRKGYAGTTVREIVESAGVTKPALYYYFENKEGLFLELMRGAHTRFLALLDEVLEGDGSAAGKIRALLERGYDLFLEHRDIARIGYAIYYGPPQGAPFFDFDDFQLKLLNAFRSLVLEGVSSGEFGIRDTEAGVLGVMAVFNLVTELELCHTQQSLGRAGVGRLLDVVFDGIRYNDQAKGKRKRS
jgi:TetR/AcrR family transcriptional regulator